MSTEVTQEHLYITSSAHDIIDLVQSLGPVSSCQRIRKLKQYAAVRCSQCFTHKLFRQFFSRAHACIQQAPRIAHAAIGGTRNQLKRCRLSF